jgi:hypothetical protein
MERLITHPTISPEIEGVQRHQIMLSVASTAPIARSVTFDQPTGRIYADLRVHPFAEERFGPGYAVVAIGAGKKETIIVAFDSREEAIDRYCKIVEICERDPLAREGDRQHAWDITDHLAVPCNAGVRF